MNSRGSSFIFLILALAGTVGAAPSPSPGASSTPQPQIDPKLFSGMKWRQVGPFRGGRALAIEGVRDEPNTWYFGAVAGGVWKTLDGGVNWTPVFDKEDISSIGAIAVAPSDHNTIYVGTGEAAIRGNTTYGTGVYKSVDAGKNWKNIFWVCPAISARLLPPGFLWSPTPRGFPPIPAMWSASCTTPTYRLCST